MAMLLLINSLRLLDLFVVDSKKKFQTNSDMKMTAYEITNSVAPEPEGSSPYSQEHATSPYPEPTGSNLNSTSPSP
jgi:hypothetical protein